jgi:hypothetical protein
MKHPAISKFERHSRRDRNDRRGERGVTMVLVAGAMVAIMAMAALSIDVVTLYLANAEAQRSADAAALAAARILSITGMTGDPTNAPTGSGTNAWQSACQMATQVATAVAQQNTVGGVALPVGQITVTYPNNADTAACSGTDPAFGVNPLVTVNVQRTNLPTFFARIWGHRGASVSATATAEAFNSSASNVSGNGGGGGLIPVQPRCVKPLLVPNTDPNTGSSFIQATDGAIQNSGIQVAGSGPGVIGEPLSLTAACKPGQPNCFNLNLVSPQPANSYLPALVAGTPVASMSCATDTYQSAIAGCDQTTVYACGVPGGTQADLTINPNAPTALAGETSTAAQCLINQASGFDSLDRTNYPYQIRAGSGNPMVQSGAVTASAVITSSNNIATIPVYDNTAAIGAGAQPFVTVVGFLQVFIDDVNGAGAVDAHILNVAGCGNGATTPPGTPVAGSSPVPVRLINYP